MFEIFQSEILKFKLYLQPRLKAKLKGFVATRVVMRTNNSVPSRCQHARNTSMPALFFFGMEFGSTRVLFFFFFLIVVSNEYQESWKFWYRDKPIGYTVCSIVNEKKTYFVFFREKMFDNVGFHIFNELSCDEDPRGHQQCCEREKQKNNENLQTRSNVP